VKLRRTYWRCKALVDALDVPASFDVRALCRRVAEQRGRLIHLEAVPLAPEGPCGLWLSTAKTDYIFFEERTSPFHQEHIIAHELGHMLCRHGRAADPWDADSLHTLLPALDPGVVGQVLHRRHYANAEEQEAEIFASLLLQRLSHPVSEPVHNAPSEAAEVLGRLDRSLCRRPVDPTS
jgi:hypothetical protein